MVRLASLAVVLVLTCSPALAQVTSVFGRTGAVTAQTGDYSFSQLSGSITGSFSSIKGLSLSSTGSGSGSSIYDSDITNTSANVGLSRYSFNRETCGPFGTPETIVGAGQGGASAAFVDCHLIVENFGGSAVASGRQGLEVLTYLQSPTLGGTNPNPNPHYTSGEFQIFANSGDNGGTTTTTTSSVMPNATVIPVTSASGYAQYNDLTLTCSDATTQNVKVAATPSGNNVTVVSGVCPSDGGMNSGANVTNWTVSPRGAIYMLGGGALAEPAATGLVEVTGGEINFALVKNATTGAIATAQYKAGLTIVGNNNDANQGGLYDCGLCFSNQSTVGQRSGILWGPMNGHFPIDPAGDFLQAVGSGTVGIGIDWSTITFTTAYFKFPNWLMDGSGNYSAYRTTNSDLAAYISSNGLVQLGDQGTGHPSTAGMLQFFTSGAGVPDSEIDPSGGSGSNTSPDAGTMTFLLGTGEFKAPAGSSLTMHFERADSSLSTSSMVADLQWKANNSSGTLKDFVHIVGTASNPTAGSEAGQLAFGVVVSGGSAPTDELAVNPGAVNIKGGATLQVNGTTVVDASDNGIFATVKTGTTTVASLGTCNSTAKGTRWVVTDATANTYGATLTGGGTTVVPVFCNGANWITG